MKFLVYVQIDGINRTFAFDKANKEELVTEKYDEALKHAQMLCREFSEYAPRKENGEVQIYIKTINRNPELIPIWDKLQKYASFRLTNQLMFLLNESGVKF